MSGKFAEHYTMWRLARFARIQRNCINAQNTMLSIGRAMMIRRDCHWTFLAGSDTRTHQIFFSTVQKLFSYLLMKAFIFIRLGQLVKKFPPTIILLDLWMNQSHMILMSWEVMKVLEQHSRVLIWEHDACHGPYEIAWLWVRKLNDATQCPLSMQL